MNIKITAIPIWMERKAQTSSGLSRICNTVKERRGFNALRFAKSSSGAVGFAGWQADAVGML